MATNQQPFQSHQHESGLDNHRIGRRQYLATYSQADESRFPTRQSFGDYIVEKFNAGTSKVKVTQWVVCKEAHEKEGFHYHCAFKMDGIKKWFTPWKSMYDDGVKVSFSDSHDYYISAYRYVTKEDKHFVESKDHPDLTGIGSPRTKQKSRMFPPMTVLQTNLRERKTLMVHGIRS